MTLLCAVANTVVQLFLLVRSCVHNLAKFFIAPPLCNTSIRAYIFSRARPQSRLCVERSHHVIFAATFSRIFSTSFGVATSDIVSSSYRAPKGPIIPLHTIAQRQHPKLREFQQVTNTIWRPPGPSSRITVSAVHGPSLTSRHLGGPQRSSTSPGPFLFTRVATSSDRNLSDIASLPTKCVDKVRSVIWQKPALELRSSPTRIT